MNRLRFDGLALCDVEEGRRFYESRQAGLGQRFADAVADTAERIAAHPEWFPRRLRQHPEVPRDEVSVRDPLPL